MGRAARHIDGKVIMYADKVTDSMKSAIEETDRRRFIQKAYNDENGITPQGIQKTIRDITERVKSVVEPSREELVKGLDLPKEDLVRLIKDLETQMKSASKQLEFEKAAIVRDQILDLRKIVADESN